MTLELHRSRFYGKLHCPSTKPQKLCCWAWPIPQQVTYHDTIGGSVLPWNFAILTKPCRDLLMYMHSQILGSHGWCRHSKSIHISSTYNTLNTHHWHARNNGWTQETLNYELQGADKFKNVLSELHLIESWYPSVLFMRWNIHIILSYYCSEHQWKLTNRWRIGTFRQLHGNLKLF